MTTSTLAWSDDLSVGSPTIDREHRELVELFQHLTDPARQDDAAFLRATLDDLVRHVGEHFEREEGIMRRWDYPNYALHRQAHGDLLDQINHFMDLMNETGAALQPARIIDFVGNWLVGHILHDDKALGGWLAAKHGATAA